MAFDEERYAVIQSAKKLADLVAEDLVVFTSKEHRKKFIR